MECEEKDGRDGRRQSKSSCSFHLRNAGQNRTGRNDLKTYESGPRESITGIEEMQELHVRPDRYTGSRDACTPSEEVDIRKV